ncbi:MAG TPA: Gfo/Idh/MocA family oxidoreductase [Candidatus Methylacidiphilales bacterium]|nr:Gfo/Idh/MocA family oxidoreductase [Candidatus Methylacidiphilales bacterium]
MYNIPFPLSPDTGGDTAEPAPARIGVIGCGHIVRTVYGPLLAARPQLASVVALCDRHAPAAADIERQWFPAARVYEEIEAMLCRENLEAVLVLTTESASARVATICLEAGVMVYLEKPPALSSATLQDLLAAERASAACVYAAFNRRHTPLFHQLRLPPGGLRRVHGRLSRKNRRLEDFPFTSVHLIDSAQFFARHTFDSVEVDYVRNGTSGWRLHGRLGNGASCDLSFYPDGAAIDEYLRFESGGGSCELRFSVPGMLPSEVSLRYFDLQGNLQHEQVDGGDDGLFSMGYGPCLELFLEHLRRGDLEGSAHRLYTCIRTVEILEAMRQSIHATLAQQ